MREGGQYHDTYIKNQRSRMNELPDGTVMGYTQPLSERRRVRADWRDYRRQAIRIALKRGLIDKDPGGAP